ncbi:MAG: hypothetical protein P9M06_05025 [Candidatus Saelkia tenebricola]|nr:hypothetical protein [Candidatus Saelkia tenebricola]
MKNLILIILVTTFVCSSVNVSYARRIKEPLQPQKDYYIALRNLLSKYVPLNKSNGFMREFIINQRIYDRNSPQLQDVCKSTRQAIFTMENYGVAIPLIHYFINSVLPAMQTELYNYPDPQSYGEVLSIIASGIRLVDEETTDTPKSIYLEIISHNSSRDDSVGAFFAQLFNVFMSEPLDFKADYSRLERIISDSYYVHTKHQILRKAFESAIQFSEDVYAGMPEVELLITGALQNNLFIKAYSISALARICMAEGISQEGRVYVFQSALNGLKSIPWDICFDRNGDIPDEVNYLAVCIDYLADAEAVCREEFGLDVDLAQDEEFVRIFRLLLMRGFDFETQARLIGEN